MEEAQRHEMKLVGTASAMHFLVDGVCICCLYLLLSPFELPELVGVVLTYNVMAFLTQPLTGIVADRARQPHLLLLASNALLAAAVLLAVVTVMTSRLHTSSICLYGVAILLGMGNSLFHVWGGRQVAVRTVNDIRLLGVFVSTGAVGLAVGFVFYSWLLLCVQLLTLSVVSIAYVCRDGC